LAAIALLATLGAPAAGSAEEATATNRHGLGVSGGVAGHSGFAYRRFIGPGVVQVNAIALMVDSGAFFAADLGVDYAWHLHIWHTRRRTWLPKSMAVRAVAGISGLVFKDEGQSFSNGDFEAAPRRPGDPVKTPQQVDPWSYMMSASAGFGVEMGSVVGPGFSLVIDIRPTYIVDEDGFWGFVTLPYGSAVYNW